MKEPLGLTGLPVVALAKTGEPGIGVDLSWDAGCFDVDFGICAVGSGALGDFGGVVFREMADHGWERGFVAFGGNLGVTVREYVM